MSKHTPGPWINCQAVGQRLSSRRIISDSNKISTVVADVPDYGKTSASERHANARLIAAAPDLLEALQSVIAAVEACEGTWDDNDFPLHAHEQSGIWDDDNSNDQSGQPCVECAQWKAAKAAIAKATGESA